MFDVLRKASFRLPRTYIYHLVSIGARPSDYVQRGLQSPPTQNPGEERFDDVEPRNQQGSSAEDGRVLPPPTLRRQRLDVKQSGMQQIAEVGMMERPDQKVGE